jgi:hypothetical protein
VGHLGTAQQLQPGAAAIKMPVARVPKRNFRGIGALAGYRDPISTRPCSIPFGSNAENDMDSAIPPGQTIRASVKASNKTGNPWHDPRNGEFTSGPNATSTASTETQKSIKEPPREKSDAKKFIDAHQNETAIIAASLNVPTENILGLSGIESFWGKGSFAKYNNFFSQHAGKKVPFQTGTILTAQGQRMATFRSYLDSGRAFAALYGNAVRGIVDPHAFAQALIKARFNSGNAKTGGNPNFTSSTASTIYSTKRRMH